MILGKHSTGLLRRILLIKNCSILHKHLVLCECTRLIAAENIDCAKCFDCCKRLAQYFALPHGFRNNRERQCNGNWETFWNDRNEDGYCIDEELGSAQVMGV